MNLLVVTTSYPSLAYPGSGIFVRRMLERLPEDIHITVLAPDSDQHKWVSTGHRISVRTFRYAPRSWQILAHRPGGIPAALKARPILWGLIPVFGLSMMAMTLVYARKADLVHAQWSVCGVVAGLASRVTGRPVVTTLRGTDVQWGEEGFVFRLAIRMCGALNQHVVVIGRAMADRVIRWMPKRRDKVVVIPNGVGSPFSALRVPTSSGYTVGVIGNLISGKKVDTVIRAFEAIAKTRHTARMLVVGDGPERHKLIALARDLGLDQQVVFTGMISPEQVPDRLAECTVLVLASSSEGRPNVILEAMAAGVPVIASDIDGVHEMIGANERGLLFPAGDEKQLAGCMQRLMRHPELGIQLAAHAGQWLRDQGLTWDHTARCYADLYRQVVAEYARKRKEGRGLQNERS